MYNGCFRSRTKFDSHDNKIKGILQIFFFQHLVVVMPDTCCSQKMLKIGVVFLQVIEKTMSLMHKSVVRGSSYCRGQQQMVLLEGEIL